MNTDSIRKGRDGSLDFIRGVAIILMIITHSFGIFYAGSNSIFDFFTWWGATVCFTLFLIVSAQLMGIKLNKGELNPRSIISRSLQILLIYFSTAILLEVLLHMELNIGLIFNILTFQHFPQFVEFLIPFALYPIILLFIPRTVILSLQKSGLITLLISGLLYVTALILFYIDVDSQYALVLKNLFVGSPGYHTFGLLAYAPIYLLGLWWGSIVVKEKESRKSIQNISLIALIGFSAAFLLIKSFTSIEWGRWPPSILLFLYGVIFYFILFIFYRYLNRFNNIFTPFEWVGRNAITYFALHIIVLYVVGIMIGWEKVGELGAISILLISISVPTLYAYLKG